MSDATVRVALYIKATTTDQAARREGTLREYASNQPGWSVVMVFADLGEARRRPALQQAFAAAETGQFDLLLVDSIEKLTGAPRVREIVERFHAAGVTAHSLAGFDSTFPLSMEFLSTIDEFHARWLQRVRLGRERGAQQAHASTPPNLTRTGQADRQREVVAVQALYAAVSDDRLPWLDELLITAGVLRRCDCTAMAPAGPARSAAPHRAPLAPPPARGPPDGSCRSTRPGRPGSAAQAETVTPASRTRRTTCPSIDFDLKGQ